MKTAITMQPPKDKPTLAKLERLTRLNRHHLPKVIDAMGAPLRVPEVLFKMIIEVAQELHAGRSVLVITGEATLTPQAAADLLGMSRQFLNRLMDRGEIAFHKVGTHRLLLSRDVQKFADRRAQSRRRTLERLRNQIQAAGLDH